MDPAVLRVRARTDLWIVVRRAAVRLLRSGRMSPTPSLPADLPRRPVLAPGLTVHRHAPGTLQIGRTAQHRLLVDDTPAVRRTLAVVARGESPPDDPDTRAALAALAPALRDGDALIRPGLNETEVAATTLRHPATAAARLDARQLARIRVLGDWAVSPSRVLARSGLAVGEPSDRTIPTAALVLCRGDLDRQVSDRLVRARVPHLVLRAVESEIVLGPFVVPGTTACLRCLDAHRAAAEPAYGVPVLDDTEPARRDGVPDPCDGALATMALGWAVHDLVRYVEGDQPSTWSATVTLTGGQDCLNSVPWSRHPACGCSWTEEAAGDGDPSVMMEA